MTTFLEALTLVLVTVLVSTVCLFVHRIDAMLRTAARSVRAIAEDTRSMRADSGAISPSIERMNQNLYGVAVQLSQVGEAAERLRDDRHA